MTRPLACCFLLFLVSSSALAFDAVRHEPLRIAPGDATRLHSTTTGSALLQRETAGPDTFDLYGGPQNLVRDPDGVPGNGDEYVEGKFQAPDGFTARGLSASDGDWTGVDLTDVEPFWQVSTFNAENLNGNGPGNRAMWCGIEADDPRAERWTDAPGYGNNWYERLVFEQVVSDPSVGQTVDLDFVFNADTELSYDFMVVEYQTRFFNRTTVYEFSGTVVGASFADVATTPITYAADDYADGDKIRIYIEFFSDGAYSDEDGLFVSDGAIQLDDIVVTTSEGTFTEGFEGPGPYLFRPEKDYFFGDFANVFAFVSDVDPCHENRSPQANFVDFGQVPPNAPGVSGMSSTGGSTSSTWNYGSTGGYVVNYTSGLEPGRYLHISNEVWSPEIDFDLPGSADDGPDMQGLVLSFDVWPHLPLNLQNLYTWRVRFHADGQWTDWRDRNFVYFGQAVYRRQTEDVTDLVEPGTDKVQVALGVVEFGGIDFPDFDSTPAPWFDNVRLSKIRVDGPFLSANEADLANDAFPVSGTIDASTQAARDLLDIRFDRAMSVAREEVIPGDSLVVDVDAAIAGSSVSSVRMHWVQRQNPTFEAAIRSLPARPGIDVDVATGVAPDGRVLWSGTVVMNNAVRENGSIVDDEWAADLPDVDFLYPGDVLHYYFAATDDGGRTATLPVDLNGFGVWDDLGRSTYTRTFTVRALPTITAGGAPDILWINDAGHRDHEEEWITAFEVLGLVEGRDFDSYTVQGASSGVGNGIGASGNLTRLGERRGHGASLDQLREYSTLVYESDQLVYYVLGTGDADDVGDPSADIPLLTAWKESPGDRASIWFGDSFVSSVQNGSAAGQSFVAMMLNAGTLGDDLQATVPGVTNPFVVPSGFTSGFALEFNVYGACPRQRRFDDLRPGSIADTSHLLRYDDGTTNYDLALGVVYDRVVGSDRRLDITFPFGLSAVNYDPQDLPVGGSTIPARGRLLEEALAVADPNFVPGQAVDAPSPRRTSLNVAPTPFNPSTVVRFDLPHVGARASVRVYDVRGQLVRTLHDRAAASAELELTWDGRDARGAVVASGVYFVRGVTEGFDATRKVMLVK